MVTGVFLISVYGFEASQFSIVGTQGTTVQLVMEGVAVQGSVYYGQYAYFQFLDAQPNLDLEIDVQPTSGDVDLYISCSSDPTGTDAGFPSRTNFNYSSTRYMEDSLWISASDRHSCSQNGGIFYIAVYGYSYYQTVSFDLRVTHYGGTKTIAVGKLVTDSVFKGIGAQYRFRMGFEAETVTVALQTLQGDADLFVGLNEAAGLGQYDYSSAAIGSSLDSVTILENAVCSDCWISIYVYGYQSSTFTLLVTMEDTVVQLTDSAPTMGSVAAGNFQFYSAVAPYGGTATAVLTVFSGSPDLFISLTNDEPVAAGDDVVADDSGSTGNLPVVSIEGVSAGQVIFVGIGGGLTNATYTVRVSVDARIITPTAMPPVYKVITGLPQSDTIVMHVVEFSNWDWKYYIMVVPAGHESLTVRGTRIIGEADFYVRRCPYLSAADCSHYLPNNTNYLLTTRDEGDDVITVNRQDESPCSYLVGVQSMSYFTAFQISQTTEHSILALQGGITVTDHANAGEVDYFSFFLGDELQVRFMLTKVSGDPDIYVTTNSSHAVTEANAMWHSVNWGSDVLDINPRTDSRACRSCTYYIAVVGVAETTYRLTATTTTNVPVLIDGMPINDRVGTLQWNYYNYFDVYGSSRDIKITLTTTSGDADLFVTLDGSTPSWYRWDYYSMNTATNDEVRISRTDEEFAPCVRSAANSGCLIRIAISGLSLQSEYSLVLTSSLSASLVSLGMPSVGTVSEDTYEYYRVVSNAGSSDVTNRYKLTFALTVFSGSVNAYLGCSGSNFPNMSSYVWRIESPDSLVTVESVDLMEHGCTSTDATVGASVFISLFGLQSSSYSVTASMDTESSMTILAPGVSTGSAVAYKSFKYFLIRPGATYLNIKLILTVEQGDADIYVSETWTNRPRYSDAQNGASSYKLSSSALGSDILIVNHRWLTSACSKNHPTGQCYVIVGIYGSYNSNTATSFTLVSSLEESTLQLANGVPIRGQVGTTNYEYYKYSLSEPNVDITFSLTPFNGDADLFVAMAPVYHPRSTNFTWMAAAYGEDTLTVQSQEFSSSCMPNPATGKHCDFFLGVYGFVNASYSLMVSMDTGFQNPITLIDGQPQAGSIQPGRYAYFRYRVSGGMVDSAVPAVILFTLTPTNDEDVDLFLNSENHGEPGRDHYDLSSVNWGSNIDQISIQPGSAFYCISCTLFLSVWGYRAAQFSLVASSQGMTQLQMGRATGGHTGTNSFLYYTAYNGDAFGKITIVLTSLSGDADLYVSTFAANPEGSGDVALPTREHYDWHAIYYGDDIITIDYTDEKFCSACVYVIGVYGYRNASFTLLVTESEDTVIRLVTNRPQIASLSDLGEIRYFSTSLHTSADDLTFSLTALDTGFADMYVQQYNQSYYEACIRNNNLKLPNPHDSSTYIGECIYAHSLYESN
jgi:hypothetical protein